MPDGEVIQRKEILTFCVKQFFVHNPPKLKDKETLLFRDDIHYLVCFKRLEGPYDVYDKIISRFCKHQDIRDVMDFEFDAYYIRDNHKPCVVSGFIRLNFGGNHIVFPAGIKRIIMDFV